MKILAIETSCDETAIAIAEFKGTKQNPTISVLSHIVSSQVEIHKKFGGVVPNLARREHEKNLVPILLEALKQYKKTRSVSHALGKKIERILAREPELLRHFKKYILPLAPPDIDAIALTYGPGLAPALWVGVNFAKALCALWGKPLIPINHMAGHFYSATLQNEKSGYKVENIQFPALGLLVSGGHTELIYTKGHGKWTIVGETRDDAAGEAFDKVARILGLPYPGGPQISKLAEKRGKTLSISLPRPMIGSDDYDFSFSGLKTAVLYLVRDLKKKISVRAMRPSVAREFQNAVIDVLVSKTIRAAREKKVKTILLGGGVAANSLLRERLRAKIKKEMPRVKYTEPLPWMTGDNALMIALAAHFVGKKKAWNRVHADANVRLG